MSITDKRRGRGTASGGRTNVLTAKMFLGKEGQDPIIAPEPLLDFYDNGCNEDVDEMDGFFDLINQRRKFSLNLRERKDAGGKLYLYVNFLGSMGPEGKKVLLIGKMKQFITNLHRGLVSIDFTFEQLVEEAESEN
jgi:hypothetical protein